MGMVRARRGAMGRARRARPPGGGNGVCTASFDDHHVLLCRGDGPRCLPGTGPVLPGAWPHIRGAWPRVSGGFGPMFRGALAPRFFAGLWPPGVSRGSAPCCVGMAPGGRAGMCPGVLLAGARQSCRGRELSSAAARPFHGSRNAPCGRQRPAPGPLCPSAATSPEHAPGVSAGRRSRKASFLPGSLVSARQNVCSRQSRFETRPRAGRQGRWHRDFAAERAFAERLSPRGPSKAGSRRPGPLIPSTWPVAGKASRSKTQLRPPAAGSTLRRGWFMTR